MTAGRLCLTPVDNSATLPDPTNDWVPLTGCAEWDGLVTLESAVGKRKLKLMFSVNPPQYSEFSISDLNGSVIASGAPVILERPTISDEDREVVGDQLRPGRYVLRCDCTNGCNYRLDIDIADWYSID